MEIASMPIKRGDISRRPESRHESRSRLATLWNLTEREAELRGFHQQLIEYVAGPNIDRRESAWRCVEAAPV